ncbi:MAG: hypothetical protein QGF00_05245 [Planctomycetota bacterium]|jgi:hypothetical protein|nr:hypothetical protein [Planctomycetota bacterium]
MIEKIQHRGVLIYEASPAGETRAEDVVPAHPNGIQISRNRWLLVYATRGFRGSDDDLSTLCQLRAETPDGPLLTEVVLGKTTNEWDPDGAGARLVKQCGHPVAFGVPKGALVRGNAASNANVICVMWRASSRMLDREKNYLLHQSEMDGPRILRVEWVQLRLNDAEDDIEILVPPRRLRQVGYEDGDAFCRHEQATDMNQSFVQPVPFNDDATEWIITEHFGNRLVPIKLKFDEKAGHYEWTETGPFLNAEDAPLFEASTLQFGDDWCISGRTRWGQPGIGWFRTNDPFGEPTALTVAEDVKTQSPHTAYMCPDGVVRVCTNDRSVSPYNVGRCPLYIWDLDPDDGFSASNRRVIFDSIAAGLPFLPEDSPTMDMCKLLPHAGGRTGYLVHRVRNSSAHHPSRVAKNLITPEAKAATGIYWAQVEYAEEYPGRWVFE